MGKAKKPNKQEIPASDEKREAIRAARREEIEIAIRAHETQMANITNGMTNVSDHGVIGSRAMDIYQENWERHANAIRDLKRELENLK